MHNDLPLPVTQCDYPDQGRLEVGGWGQQRFTYIYGLLHPLDLNFNLFSYRILTVSRLWDVVLNRYHYPAGVRFDHLTALDGFQFGLKGCLAEELVSTFFATCNNSCQIAY